MAYPTGFGLTSRFLAAFLGFSFVAVAGATQAAADKRVALVIGNSAYRNVTKLPNPAKDAASIGDMLKKAGFDIVDAREDVSNAEMRHMIRDFSDKARDADVALVFYAGHGIEIDGINYLLPVDTRLERDVDVEDEAVSLDRIVRILDPVKKLRLVILDACRDNPFQQTMKRSLSSRGVQRGLAKVEPQSPNTLIAYAAKAGSTAADGDDSHSPFTTALLKQLPVPGQDLRRSLGYVRDEVLKSTDNKQEPFVYGSLGGDDVVLVPGATRPAAAVPAQVTALDPNSPLRMDYELAAQVNTRAGWDAFLASHPKGYYADLARAARDKLSPAAKQDVAAANSGPRNLSAADPAGHPATAPAAGIDDYVGKSYRVTYAVRLEEFWPDPGKIDHAGREIAIYVKSRNDILSRFVSLPLSPTGILRYARAPLGGVDQGVQVTYSDNRLQYMIPAPNYRVKVAVTANGNSCTASLSFELQPNQPYYLFGRTPNGDPYKISSMTAENVACSVSPGDAIGEPVATAAQTPPAGPATAAAAPASSPTNSATVSPPPQPGCHQDAWQASSLKNETASANQTTTGGAACLIHLQSGLDSPYASIASRPKNGTLSQIDTFTLKYQPNPGYKGPDQYIFKWCASDNKTGRSGCSTITYNVTVN
jgi:Caspase domain